MLKVCSCCQETVHIHKGKNLHKCAIHSHACCGECLFRCKSCDNEICKNHLANFSEELVHGKTARWKGFICTVCDKMTRLEAMTTAS